MDEATKNECRTFFLMVEDQVPTDESLEPVFHMLHRLRCMRSSNLAFLSERDIEANAKYGQLQLDHKNFFKMMFVARQTNEVKTTYAEANGGASGNRRIHLTRC